MSRHGGTRTRSGWAGLTAGLAGFLVVGALGWVASAAPPDGRALYLSNCSNCHGVLTAAGQGRLDSPPGPRRARIEPAAFRSGPTAPPGPRPDRSRAGARLAVALPFGPTLNGVVGREAGTVPGFQYSRAFLVAMRGVVWTRATLDRWITDTPAWVPGAIMVYRQPDPAIRARIIDYLEHPWAGPDARETAPRQGGEIDDAARVIRSAIRR